MSGSAVRKHDIDDWDAEDVDAWNNGGAAIARRNLIWSVIAEHVGFSVWSIWSVMVLFMPQNVYHIDAAGKFFLVAVPTLVGGAVLRLPYTFATATFGGPQLDHLLRPGPAGAHPADAVLHGPARHLLHHVHDRRGVRRIGRRQLRLLDDQHQRVLPQRYKGWALGLNAGGGNIGVPAIQLIGLLVIANAGNRAPHLVCAVYLVFIAIAAVGAALFMDNLTNQRTNGRSMIEVMGHRDSWLIALLYIGTFGSFIGFSFAFGQVLQINFLAGLTHGKPATAAMSAAASLHAAQIAFLGPLLGSLSRPLGGWFADRIGGGKITLYTFGGDDPGRGLAGRCRGDRRRAKGPPDWRDHGRLRHRLRGAIHPVRSRQRLGVQDDPIDLRRQGPQPGRGSNRPTRPPGRGRCRVR